MAMDGLVTLPLASLGPEIWAKPAVEGGRTTTDESLTALPRPVYLRPPDGVTCMEDGASAQGLAGAHQTPQLLLTQGAHLVSSNPEEGTEATLATCRGALPHIFVQVHRSR